MPEVLPERMDGAGGVLIRRWRVEDAARLVTAVTESAEHLRPWMGWVTQEPHTVAAREVSLAEWERAWASGGDVLMGIFLGEEVAGGCGLHRRIAPDGLEIGYWIHPRFLRRRLATTTARLLTDAAFSLPSITHVEIRHDKANLASAGIPKKLGFTLAEEVPDGIQAPAEVGIEYRWRMDRNDWMATSPGSRDRPPRPDYVTGHPPGSP